MFWKFRGWEIWINAGYPNGCICMKLWLRTYIPAGLHQLVGMAKLLSHLPCHLTQMWPVTAFVSITRDHRLALRGFCASGLGPTTPFVSARRTEQALLQVINSAAQTLIITSFVAYDVSTIVKALNAACDRGVIVSMLLELSQQHGGRISFDATGTMKNLVPAAKLYAWEEKDDEFSGGSVHAKVAVADGRVCFITSANLTGHAMEKNMEAGVLISGGQIPKLLDGHMTSLFHTNLVTRV